MNFLGNIALYTPDLILTLNYEIKITNFPRQSTQHNRALYPIKINRKGQNEYHYGYLIFFYFYFP